LISDGWGNPYPPEVHDALVALTPNTERGGRQVRVDELAFYLFAPLDLAEQAESRRASLVYIGRYGKQPWGSLTDLPVTEVLRWHNQISTLVEEENEHSKPK
jgi:hypothetical protein